MSQWYKILGLLFLVGVGTTAPAYAGNHGNDEASGKRSGESTAGMTHRSGLSFSDLVPPEATDITIREACGLFTLATSYLQARNQKNLSCAPSDLLNACQDAGVLFNGASQFMSSEDKQELTRKLTPLIPKIISTVYSCLKTVIKDPKVNSKIRQVELLLSKKKELIKWGCEGIKEMAGAGAKPKDGSSPHKVDFENPCGALANWDDTATNACVNTLASGCLAASGNVELEALFPPSIYDASIAKKLFPNGNGFALAGMDGAIDFIKQKGLDKGSEVLAEKAGAVGAIALATIAQSVKQIYQASETGNNDIAHCFKTDQAGACFHKLFLGGIPKSSALVRAEGKGANEHIDCCAYKVSIWIDDGYFWDTGPIGGHLGDEDHLAPIENAPFKDTFCYQQEGTIKDRALVKSENGDQIYEYVEPHSAHRVTIAGHSCAMPDRNAKDRSIKVLASSDPKAPKTLYAPGARPGDATVPARIFDDQFRYTPGEVASFQSSGPVVKKQNPPPASLPNNPIAHSFRDPIGPLASSNTDWRRVARPATSVHPTPARQNLPSFADLPSVTANPVVSRLESNFRIAKNDTVVPSPIIIAPDVSLPELANRPSESGNGLFTPSDPLAESNRLRALARPPRTERNPIANRSVLPPSTLANMSPNLNSRPATAIHSAPHTAPRVEFSKRGETPKASAPRSNLTMPAPPTPKNNAVAAPKIAPPAKEDCFCRKEWSRPNDFDHSKQAICVVDRNNDGKWVDFTKSYEEDPGCQLTCGFLTRDAKTSNSCKRIVAAPTSGPLALKDPPGNIFAPRPQFCPCKPEVGNQLCVVRDPRGNLLASQPRFSDSRYCITQCVAMNSDPDIIRQCGR